VIVDCAIYEHGQRRDGASDLALARRVADQPDTFVWIGLLNPGAAELESVADAFQLHPLAVEDAIETHQRPKIDIYDEMLFVVLKTARYVDPEEVVEIGEIMVFLGEGYVVTVRHGEGSPLAGVRAALERDPDLLGHGPSAVLHAIIDWVVDGYGPALDGLDTDVEQVEEQVFTPQAGINPVERIYKLKREVLHFLRATAPLIDPVTRLAQGHYAQIHPEVRTYFRDVNDHLMRARDQLESLNDLLSSVLGANLTQISVRQNEDMRKISAWVAIAAVPTMIAGVYGMNFDEMPELAWAYGYPLVVAVMASICSLLYWRFRRAGWL
jgi:magnesium transporter